MRDLRIPCLDPRTQSRKFPSQPSRYIKPFSLSRYWETIADPPSSVLTNTLWKWGSEPKAHFQDSNSSLDIPMSTEQELEVAYGYDRFNPPEIDIPKPSDR